MLARFIVRAIFAAAGLWLAAQIVPGVQVDDTVSRQVVRTLEFAGLAKYGFGVAKMFSGFYQNPKQSVVNEDREDVRMWRVAAVLYCRQQLGRALDLMGVAVPARM